MLMHGPMAFKEGPNGAWQNSKTVGTPAYTRERERAQTADRVVVKYLNLKARASTANRRSRSDVGGARRGVLEYGAVNYHKAALEELEREQEKSSANRRQKKCSANRRQKKSSANRRQKKSNANRRQRRNSSAAG